MTKWDDARDATLQKWWDERPLLTASEIGDRMGETKNVILGRAHRLGLAPRGNKSADVRWAGHVKATHQPLRVRAPKKEAPPVLKLTSIAPVPVGKGRGCLWPVGEHRGAAYWTVIARGEVLECGDPVTMRTLPDGSRAASVYCEIHYSKSFARRAA